jgi:hypothetical protein
MRYFITSICFALLYSTGSAAAAPQSGLGGYKATVTPDNRLKYTLESSEFTFTRLTAADTGATEITIAGSNEVPVVIRFGGQPEISVERGGQRRTIARGDTIDKVEAVAALLNGRAVTAFRRIVGSYELELMNDPAALGAKSAPFGYALLLTAAFVGQLAGDPNAVERTRDLIRRRIAAKLQAVAWRADCVTEYELALLANDTRYTQCQDAAESQDSWYERAAQRAMCAAEFLAGALSAETQFIACSGLAPLKIQ